jgi:hypothetical protein
MSEQPPKSQPVDLANGMIFGMLAGVTAYAVTQWPPAIALGMSAGLLVALVVNEIRSRQKRR